MAIGYGALIIGAVLLLSAGSIGIGVAIVVVCLCILPITIGLHALLSAKLSLRLTPVVRWLAGIVIWLCYPVLYAGGLLIVFFTASYVPNNALPFVFGTLGVWLRAFSQLVYAHIGAASHPQILWMMERWAELNVALLFGVWGALLALILLDRIEMIVWRLFGGTPTRRLLDSGLIVDERGNVVDTRENRVVVFDYAPPRPQEIPGARGASGPDDGGRTVPTA